MDFSDPPQKEPKESRRRSGNLRKGNLRGNRGAPTFRRAPSKRLNRTAGRNFKFICFFAVK